MALFKIVREDDEKPFICIGIGLIWIMSSVFEGLPIDTYSSPFFWLAVSTLAIFAWVCLHNNISLAPIDYFGKISYSAYLIHFVIIQLVEFISKMSIDMHSKASFLVGIRLQPRALFRL